MLHLWYEQSRRNYFCYFRCKRTLKLSKNISPNMTFGITFTTFWIWNKKTRPILLVSSLTSTPKLNRRMSHGSQLSKLKGNKETTRKSSNSCKKLFKECKNSQSKSIKRVSRLWIRPDKKLKKSTFKIEDWEEKLEYVQIEWMRFYKSIFHKHEWISLNWNKII